MPQTATILVPASTSTNGNSLLTPQNPAIIPYAYSKPSRGSPGESRKLTPQPQSHSSPSSGQRLFLAPPSSMRNSLSGTNNNSNNNSSNNSPHRNGSITTLGEYRCQHHSNNSTLSPRPPEHSLFMAQNSDPTGAGAGLIVGPFQHSFAARESVSQKFSTVTAAFSRRLIDTHDNLKKMGLTQIMYITGLVLFTFTGGVIFRALDREAGLESIRIHKGRCLAVIQRAQTQLVADCGNRTLDGCQNEILMALQTVDRCHKECRENCTKVPSLPMSNLGNAIIFASTTYTTIGYGSIYPTTTACKAFTIIYTLIGIPYFLALLQAIGRWLRILFIRFWNWSRRKVSAKLCKISRLANKYCAGVDTMKLPRRHQLWFPFFLGCIVAMSYLCMEAYILQLMLPPGELGFFDCFYFIVTSVTLVGFGDVFPKDATVVLYHAGLMLFGICLMSMCFFILQESLMEEANAATDKVSQGVQVLTRKVSRDIVGPFNNRISGMSLRRNFSLYTRSETQLAGAGKRLSPDRPFRSMGRIRKRSQSMDIGGISPDRNNSSLYTVRCVGDRDALLSDRGMTPEKQLQSFLASPLAQHHLNRISGASQRRWRPHQQPPRPPVTSTSLASEVSGLMNMTTSELSPLSSVSTVNNSDNVTTDNVLSTVDTTPLSLVTPSDHSRNVSFKNNSVNESDKDHHVPGSPPNVKYDSPLPTHAEVHDVNPAKLSSPLAGRRRRRWRMSKDSSPLITPLGEANSLANNARERSPAEAIAQNHKSSTSPNATANGMSPATKKRKNWRKKWRYHKPTFGDSLDDADAENREDIANITLTNTIINALNRDNDLWHQIMPRDRIPDLAGPDLPSSSSSCVPLLYPNDTSEPANQTTPLLNVVTPKDDVNYANEQEPSTIRYHVETRRTQSQPNHPYPTSSRPSSLNLTSSIQEDLKLCQSKSESQAEDHFSPSTQNSIHSHSEIETKFSNGPETYL